MLRVRRAVGDDRDEIAALRVLLWPDGAYEEHRQEVESLLATSMCGTLPAAIYVAEDDAGRLAGFLEIGLRSHADGCDPERPVGFVEGWFVREEFRSRGAGRELMRAAEEWAHRMRCREMASDALIENAESLIAHAALGFEEVDRCVHFRKALED